MTEAPHSSRKLDARLDKKIFYVTPPLLMPWIPADVHQRSLVMLDLEPDYLDEKRTKLNINVAFRGVALRSGKSVKCILGCESVVIIVSSGTGRFIDNTGPMTIAVKRKTTNSEARKSTVTLKPDVSVKAAKAEASASLGEVTYERGRDIANESEYDASERVLSPVNSVRSVEWQFDLPKGASVTRDYIHGNLHLYAVCEWDSEPKSGRIVVQPSEWTIYGHDKQPLSRTKNLLMRYLLSDVIQSVHGRDGLSITFKEIAG